MSGQTHQANVKVAVRIRPLVDSEIEQGCVEVVGKADDQAQVTVRDREAFTYDYVFGKLESQDTVYGEAVEPLIDNLFHGYNVTILAYGQTGSGKTYTMGTANLGDDIDIKGVIPRAVREIFDKIDEQKDAQIKVHCSFYELYNEEVYDLLTGPEESREMSVRTMQTNKIVGLIEKVVHNPEECLNFLNYGSLKRSTGATAMNKQSSRSHALFSINLRKTPKDGAEITSRFLLADLAGSERSKKTKATGDRLKEGVNINLGLFALGKVICALCKPIPGHIPYRDSVLTRLLQDSLGGNSFTLMIACVSPADYNAEETTSTLQYANRAKNIKNKPAMNIDPTKAELKRLRAEVEKLRLALAESNPSLLLNSTPIDRTELIKMTARNNELTKQLHSTLMDVANVEMRAILAEDACTDVAKKIENLKLFILDLFNNKLDDIQTLQTIKAMFDEIDQIMDKYRDEKNQSIATPQIVNDHEEDEVKVNFEKHTVKQQNMATQLRDINSQLAIKEQLHQRIIQSVARMTTYDPEATSIDINKDYVDQINHLTKELDELKNLKTEQKCAKLAEERRKKVQELEANIEKLRKKCMQQEKLIKAKAKDGERVKLLDTEIREMKAIKVKLLRQMRQESEQFRQWRLSKEREITKMKQIDQKRKLEMVRKDVMHEKQQNVLRRKMEDALATSKRLKEALDKQSAARSQKNSKTNNVSQMLMHEINVLNSVVDAKLTVKQLMEDRGTLNSRLLQLKKNPEENNNEISSLQQQIELRNAQISDLQTQIISTDIDSKVKNIGEQLVNVADLKAAYKILMEKSLESRQNFTQYKLDMDELKVHTEQLEEDKKSQDQIIKDQQIKFHFEMNEMQLNYETKMSYLLREIDTLKKKVSSEPGNDTFVIESDRGMEEAMADTLDNLREELDTCKNYCTVLETELEELRHNGVKPRRATKEKVPVIEILDDDISDFDDSDDEFTTDDSDPDWRKTPIAKRARRTSLQMKNSFVKPDIPARRNISSDGPLKCNCNGDCSTNRCSCKKRGEKCGENCKCTEKCINVIGEGSNGGANGPDNTQPVNDKSESSDNETFNSSDKRSLEETENNDESDFEQTPKRLRPYNPIEITTPVYPYATKKRKPLLELHYTK